MSHPKPHLLSSASGRRIVQPGRASGMPIKGYFQEIRQLLGLKTFMARPAGQAALTHIEYWHKLNLNKKSWVELGHDARSASVGC